MSESSPSPSTELTASSLYLTFDPPPPNLVEEAGQNHFERPTPPLSSVERFYVSVAQAFAQQEIDRRTFTQPKPSPTHRQPTPTSSPTSSPPAPSTLILQQLSRSCATLDHFHAMLDNLLTHRHLSIALTHPDKDPTATESTLDPSSPAFLLTRRNRLAVLLHSHHSHLHDAAQQLHAGAAVLRRSLCLHHRFMADLQRLSQHWLVRHKPTTTTSQLPPLMVDISVEDITPPGAGRVMLRRDDDGHVAIDSPTGKRTPREQLHHHTQRQRRQQRRQRREERQRTAQVEDDEWKDDDAAPRPPAASPLSASSARGWVGAAARLHRAQRQLLHVHVHGLMMKEAQGWSMGELCSVSVVHERITVESSTFPTAYIDWDDGPTSLFTVRSASSRLTRLLHSDLLHLSLLPPLLAHYARYSTANKPLALAYLADPSPPPPPPPLLPHVITCIYHTHLSSCIRRLLHTLVLPHPSVTLSSPPPPHLNTLTFTLHRGSLLMLHITVVGVDVTAIVRRNVRVDAVGVARALPVGDTGGVGGEWDVSEMEGPCGHAGVELVHCASLEQLRSLIHFAVHQPLYPSPS